MKNQFKVNLFFFKVFILSIYIQFLSPTFGDALGAQSKPPQVHKGILKGIELIYDGKFDAAEDLFRRLVAENPKDPAGYFYLAMVTWSRLASGFWTPEMVQQYGERIDETIFIARKLIENERADSFTYFYLGGALGFKGRFQLMRHKWLSSFFLALEAIRALETCKEMDPENKDVLFGLGIFDYYTARLSGVLKFLSYLLVHKGSKEEGLRKLHIAAQEATYSSIEAKSLLLHIYLFLEKDHFQKAVLLAQELAERFKESPRNKYLEGVGYIRLRKKDKYQEVLDFLRLRSSRVNSQRKAAVWRRRAHYLEASYLLFENAYEKARQRLDTILSQPDPEFDPLMLAWPLLKKGMSYDLEANRDEAVRYYRKILKMKNGAGAQFLAEKYLDEPVKRGDPFLGY